MKNIFGRRILIILVLIITLIFNLRIILTRPVSPDSWTHIAIGKFVFENRAIPVHSDLSYKTVDFSLEFISHSWLSDVILYIASIDQRAGVLFLIFPIILLTVWLTRRILNLLVIPEEIQWFTITLGLLTTASFWKLHPFIFMVPLSLSIILVYMLWKKGFAKVILLWPVILMLWANLNGGFILIPIAFILLIAFFEICFCRRGLNFLVISVFLAIVSTLLNPSFARIWIYTFTALAVIGGNGQISSLPGALSTLNQNFTKNSPPAFFEAMFLAYLIFLVLALGIVIVKDRYKFLAKNYILLPMLFFLGLPIFWVKFIPLGVFSTLPVLSVILAPVAEDKKSVWGRKILNISYGMIVLTVCYLYFQPVKSGFEPPRKQIEIIKEFNLPSNLFTTYDLTGFALYSILPKRVMLDAQDDLFDDNVLVNIYTWPQSVSDKFFTNLADQNNLNTILAGKNIGGLVPSLSQNPDWALIYFDKSGFLFVRKEAVSAQFLKANELHYLNLTRNLGFNPEELASASAEMEKFTQKYPESNLALGQLASLYRFQKNYPKAESTLGKIPAKDWDFTVYTENGRLKAAEGLCKSAEESFLKALEDRDEQNYSRTVLDLAILYAGCLHDNKKAKHYFLRYNSFLITPVEREKLRQIMKNFGVSLE